MTDDRKRAGAAERRRAATYLAQLAWLEGYPDEHGWRRLDSGEVIALDGAMIASARRKARTVMREHASALPKLVGDVATWWAITDAKLAWCSGAAAGRASILDLTPHLAPRTLRLALQLASGPHCRAAGRMVIAWAARADVLAYALDWLVEHVERLRDFEDRLVLALARLVAQGDRGKARSVRERGVDALIELLGVDAPHPVAALDRLRNIQNRFRETGASATPVPPRSAAAVMWWILRIATRETSVRQRVLALVAEAQLAEALAPWQLWEQRHAALIVRAEELASVRFEVWNEAVHKSSVMHKLEQACTQAPVPVAIGDALLELDMLGKEALIKFHAPILRLLSAMPAALGPAARARMLLHVARTAATADDDEHVEAVWDALADALEDGAPSELLGPWKSALTGDGYVHVESDLEFDVRRRGDTQRAVRVLVELARRGKLAPADCFRLTPWIEAGLTDVVRVADVIERLRDTEGWLPVALARGMLALADATADDLEAVAKRMFAITENWRLDVIKRFSAFIEQAVRTGEQWIVRDVVMARGRDLTTIAETLRLLPRSRWPQLTNKDQAAAWIARYPAALATALRRLASVDADAERMAAKRLARDLPDPAALRREIQALRERRDKPGAAKRLANLEARLARPRCPSPARLARLATKLERTACEIALTRFGATLTTTAIDRVRRVFALSEYPEWGRDSRTLVLLSALLDLEAHDRALAGRLVRARCGPPPWDLRDDPVNVAFLDAMRRAKVDPAPWLDDTARAVSAAGEPLTLALTSDPIEVFAMGAHFETCLAPNASNFFSVVANAADINKRVLYARRGDRVVGRCLLALTDAFGILTFNVYSHERSDLANHVRDFALDLARRMNTTVVPAGSVQTLLARDWYDDGTRDLVGRFQSLEEELDFTVVPAAFVDAVRRAFGREPDDVTLPIVLAHAGVRNRPELVFSLTRYVLASSVPSIRIAAAQLALTAGNAGLADRMLGEYATTIDIAHHAWPHGELLARLRPSYALSRLRETRERHVRSWQQDTGDRIAVAGVALEALCRPKQAARRYRLAMREDWLEPIMRERLAALGEPIEL